MKGDRRASSQSIARSTMFEQDESEFLYEDDKELEITQIIIFVTISDESQTQISARDPEPALGKNLKCYFSYTFSSWRFLLQNQSDRVEPFSNLHKKQLFNIKSRDDRVIRYEIQQNMKLLIEKKRFEASTNQVFKRNKLIAQKFHLYKDIKSEETAKTLKGNSA
jgi:hypothetical protein